METAKIHKTDKDCHHSIWNINSPPLQQQQKKSEMQPCFLLLDFFFGINWFNINLNRCDLVDFSAFRFCFVNHFRTDWSSINNLKNRKEFRRIHKNRRAKSRRQKMRRTQQRTKRPFDETTRNNPKQPETTRNNTKQHETTWNDHNIKSCLITDAT